MPTHKHLRALNKVILRLKDTKGVNLMYTKLPGDRPCRILVLSDASFNSRIDAKKCTHYGHVVLLMVDNEGSNEG